MPRTPRVAIIGRANVGKSTLFNRLTSGSRALTSPIPGTTRDRKEGECRWIGKRFVLIDTGGFDVSAHDALEKKIAAQAKVAVADADLILFVVDAETGPLPQDVSVANFLRTVKKPTVLIANKADSLEKAGSVTEFYTLGFGRPWPVSAISGLGTGDLLDAVVGRIRATTKLSDDGIRVAVIGRPNVGKSTLINALVGNERTIVHDEPYTTRDANEVRIKFHGVPLTLIDTAGVRKKSKIDPLSIEASSSKLSLETIYHTDVAILVTEAHGPLGAQDKQLGRLISDSKSSAIIVGNKWDLVQPQAKTNPKQFERYYRTHLNFLSFAPLIFMSAKLKTNTSNLKHAILKVHHEQFRQITDNAASKLLAAVIRRQKPMGSGPRHPFIDRIQQVGIKPPQFVVFIDPKAPLQYAYLNFLKRMIREKFGFSGAPIKMWIEKKPKK